MKMKVLVLYSPPSPEAVLGVKLGVHMESEMLADLLEEISSKIVPLGHSPSIRPAAEKASKIVLENY